MHADLPRFTGSVEHALDDKGRLIVPARFRERLGPGFVLTVAPPDPCLALLPSVTWAKFCDRLEAVPRKDEAFRRFVRHLFAHTEEVACDAQGRLVIPAALRLVRRDYPRRRLRGFAHSRRGLGQGTLRGPRRSARRGRRVHRRPGAVLMWQDVVTHVPVLLEPAMELLAIRTDGIYVDATFGAGGHSKAILARLGSGRLIALDADPSAAVRAQAIADTRLIFVHANFRTLCARAGSARDRRDRRRALRLGGFVHAV